MKEKKDSIEQLFSQFENQWDTETPRLGHSERFLKKLNAENGSNQKEKLGCRYPWLLRSY
jgi:hypothetical protein